ncbi:MAG TPA: DEAD/DEAH box helicase [Thermoleophilaceae bacterium]|nr:DEAD/DEAH box helicase [Thermoleophilaceae bacterium]
MSVQSFADLGVSSVVVGALAERGITVPFPVQQRVVPDVLAGRDVLVKSPTGSGKTLAFGLPLVDGLEAAETARPAALVLAPTRELAQQIVAELRDVAHVRALSIAAVYGGAGIERQAKLARRAHILVATPGRLEDLLERRALSLRNVRVFVLDEADRMLDMGFRPAVERIAGQLPAARQTLFFSATLDGEAGRIAHSYTRDARRHEMSPPRRERQRDVEHRFVAVSHERKLDELLDQLGSEGRGRTLVFVRTKRGADRLVKRLHTRGVDSVAMHGNKTQAQRERALAAFEGGRIDTLIATDVAARGLDIDGVTHVINFDAPDSRESYVHRVGRTGRAGNTGTGVTFVMADQAADLAAIAGELRLQAQFARAGFSTSTPVGAHAASGERRAGGRKSRGRR